MDPLSYDVKHLIFSNKLKAKPLSAFISSLFSRHWFLLTAILVCATVVKTTESEEPKKDPKASKYHSEMEFG